MRLAKSSTQSVLDRQAFARYHYREIVRLSKAFERSHLANCSIIHMYTHEGHRKREAFKKYIIKAGAHATAAVQSLHAIPDILAHAVYFACGKNLDVNPLEEQKIALPTVVGALKNDESFKRPCPLLKNSQTGELWHHLAAISNLSKHRNVVRASLNEDLTNKRKNYRELQFQPFIRNEKYFTSLSFQELLEPEYKRLSLLVISLGHELHACLQTHVERICLK